nr:immunoglobulin heavy chain junction region [Mus musculus]MBK4189699.1 immunoglobulin heavy chain junction region [Mus musculus]MBK4189700.1 immunoglobulin heavy chain junction region [Mus musculus]
CARRTAYEYYFDYW